MIISKESDCEYSVFDSLEYICDCCNKSLMVRSLEDLDLFTEIFDVEAGYEEELYCWDCSKDLKVEIEIIEGEIDSL